MAQPNTRQGLIEYGKRQLGAPVLEINVADEQIEDALDDTIIFYQDRHMDGVEKMYLNCLLYTSPSPRDVEESRMPSSA